MKCTDLKIGNYVKFYDPINGTNIYRVYYIADYGNISSVSLEGKGQLASGTIKDIEPIELTEEVLLKIGFEKDGNNYSLVCGDIEVGYYIDKFKQVLYINISREKRFYKNELRSYDVKYLHQLQNAYYLLTNEEMEVNL